MRGGTAPRPASAGDSRSVAPKSTLLPTDYRVWSQLPKGTFRVFRRPAILFAPDTRIIGLDCTGYASHIVETSGGVRRLQT